MKNILFIFLLFLIVSCHQSSTHHSSASAKSDEGSRIQVSWFVGLPVIDVNATAQVIGRGYNWTEGPVWIAGRQTLIFSDVPENKIFQWKEGDSAKVYLMPSGYTGTLPRGGEIGSNGLALDNKGRLLLCQSGNRQVARMEGSLASPVPKYTSLAGRYKGRKFNSPNDLITDSKGNIYFTDPIYGLPKGANDPERELKFEGVYKIDVNGKLSLLIDSISRPNGLALSPAEDILYLASSDENRPAWYAYHLNKNRDIVFGGVLLDATLLRKTATVKQGPDGFKIDKFGNIFSAGPDGINIISPEGTRIGLIRIPGRSSSNCVFNETKDVLFVTADDIVLKINLHPEADKKE
ncbi:MAG: SMP-30/gluconolactonase/LRE family protein [Sphingobacteriales bacterium]|nr:SMP-30/gluconolactonase/LRE family protein [Sphingobacteriales bacterium]OJY81631.1 MAG: hypothetical protein BGP14_02255 [Sphingobacteriales bacterium 44-15]